METGAVEVHVTLQQAPVVPAPMPPQAPMAAQALYPQQGGYDPRYDQSGHHGHGYGHKRKKSWLEEIFD